MKLKRRGLIGTILYHALVLMILIFAGLTFPDPPPEEEGILVNFGTEDTGMGALEPSGDEQNAGDPDLPVVQETREEPEPVPQTYTPPEPTPVDQTQDVEETPVKEVAQPTPEEIERQRQAELERERKQEEERIRQEQERLEREKQERERQQAERLNNLGRNAFGRQGVGQEQGSQGEAGGTGNQGVTSGSPDADRYGTGGGLGDGISYGLGSRKAFGSLPKPNVSGCEVTSRIEVTVDIQVDRDGKVVNAVITNATYQDKCIWDMVVEAARRSRFSVDQDASFRQTGWIKYIIVP